MRRAWLGSCFNLLILQAPGQGLIAICIETGETVYVKSRATVFATGGAGRIYASTTNAEREIARDVKSDATRAPAATASRRGVPYTDETASVGRSTSSPLRARSPPADRHAPPILRDRARRGVHSHRRRRRFGGHRRPRDARLRHDQPEQVLLEGHGPPRGTLGRAHQDDLPRRRCVDRAPRTPARASSPLEAPPPRNPPHVLTFSFSSPPRLNKPSRRRLRQGPGRFHRRHERFRVG